MQLDNHETYRRSDKKTIAKVYKDLKLDHNDQYPIKLNFWKKEDPDNRFNIDYWSGWYDYSKGFPPDEMYENYIISIKDKDGTPFSVFMFSEEVSINIDQYINYTSDGGRNVENIRYEEINLGFLWNDINEKILDGPNPFDEKWRTERIKYRKFNKTGPLEKVLELLIIAYKNDSPRDFFYIGKNGDAIYKDNLTIQLKEHLVRTDIEKITETKKDQNGLDIYVERFFEFTSSHDFTQMVEKTLKGKDFTKTIQGNKTVFIINNSPIDSIELTPKSFRLTINDQIYKYKY